MVGVLGQEVALKINGDWQKFKTLGPVQVSLSPTFGEKVVIGDASRADSLFTPSYIVEDLSGGFGVEIMDPRSQFDRFWDSTLWTLDKNQLVLPPRVKNLGSGTVAAGKDVVVGTRFGTSLYVAFTDDVRRVETDDSISASRRTLGNTATDAISFAGKLLFAYGSNYDHSADGTTWTTVSPAVKATYFALWDSKLWKIHADGTDFASSTDGLSWTAKASIDVGVGDVRGFEVFFSPDGLLNLHAITRNGLWVYDGTANTWRQTMFQHARHPDAGLGHVFHRDALYNSMGLSVWKFSGSTVTNVGLDKDYGLPADQRGKIVKLLNSQNWLVAAVDASQPSAVGSPMFTTYYSGAVEFLSSLGYSGLYLYNDRGWNHLWRSGSTSRATKWAGITDAYGDYRLFFGENGKLAYIKLSANLFNALQSADAKAWGFAESGYLVTPWFDGTWAEIDKLAVELRVRTRQTTTTETVKVSMGYDLDPNIFTEIDTIKAPGQKRYVLNEGVGKKFEYLRFKIDMQRGSDIGKTPALVYLGLRYTKEQDGKKGLAATLDVPSQEQNEALESLMNVKALVPVAWADGDGSDEVHYMKVVRLIGQTWPGTDGRTRWQLGLQEL